MLNTRSHHFLDLRAHHVLNIRVYHLQKIRSRHLPKIRSHHLLEIRTLNQEHLNRALILLSSPLLLGLQSRLTMELMTTTFRMLELRYAVMLVVHSILILL